MAPLSLIIASGLDGLGINGSGGITSIGMVGILKVCGPLASRNDLSHPLFKLKCIHYLLEGLLKDGGLVWFSAIEYIMLDHFSIRDICLLLDQVWLHTSMQVLVPGPYVPHLIIVPQLWDCCLSSK
jgi:hypothetical protein